MPALPIPYLTGERAVHPRRSCRGGLTRSWQSLVRGRYPVCAAVDAVRCAGPIGRV